MGGTTGGGTGGRAGSGGGGTDSTGGKGGTSDTVTPDETGCGCRIATSTSSSSRGPLAWLAALPLAALLLRRRQR
jgi:hypothetical protein